MWIILYAGSEQRPDRPIRIARIGSVEQDIAENYCSGLVCQQSVSLEQTMGWAVQDVGYVGLPGLSLEVDVVGGVANQGCWNPINPQIPGINWILVRTSVTKKLHGHLGIGERRRGQKEQNQKGKGNWNLTDASHDPTANKHSRRLSLMKGWHNE